MTDKLREAAAMALEALENERCHVSANWDNIVKAITSLREALAEQAEQEPCAPYGFCPICGRRGISRERRIDGNDICVTGHRYASSEAIPPELIEPVKQEPVAWGRVFDGDIIDCICPEEHALNEGVYTIPLYAAPVQQAEQKPVAWIDLTGAEIGEVWTKHPRDFDKCVAIIEKFKDKNTNPVHTKEKPVAWMCSDSKLLGIGYSRFSECCAGVWNIPVYAAPVQQVDLTDDVCDEIIKMAEKECGVSTIGWDCLDPCFIVRAVIAAYKEKQK